MKDSVLDRIHSEEDIKKLSLEELESLSEEIRGVLIDTVSKTGGHLASNLGVVELTVALHRVFDLPEDQIVWDVGHQCYTHKILTDRRGDFATLRQENGLSGFPKRKESPFDAFDVGHSSTSVAAGFGLKNAKDLLGKEGKVVAVIGDGALTGGLAYEGLNNVGRFHRNFVVILNDNRLSISKNVGAMARYLAVIRTKPAYHRAKSRLESVLKKIPLIGKPVYRGLSGVKSMIKNAIYPSNMFEDLGFQYIGPIDGHNYQSLLLALQQAREENRPTFVHVCTVKGKGYSFAEKAPSDFHGISVFDPDTGEKVSGSKGFSEVFGTALTEMASQDERICAITAAMKLGTGLQKFDETHRERFFDVGIAEEYAVTFAGGLAANGMLPVFAVYSTFLQRAYDQLLHDVALQNLHIVLGIDRAGLVGDDGETHQGVFDVSFLNPIPNCTIFSPTYFEELQADLKTALYDREGLVAVRYPRGGEPAIPADFQPNGAEFQRYPEGKARGEVLLVTYGRLFGQAVAAAEELKNAGIPVDILKLNQIKPLTEEMIAVGKEYRTVLFFEEGMVCGGVGASYELALLRGGFSGKVEVFGIEETFVGQATVARQLELCGLDAKSMSETIRRVVEK